MNNRLRVCRAASIIKMASVVSTACSMLVAQPLSPLQSAKSHYGVDSVSQLSADQLSDFEQQARQRGYTEQQIDMMKRRYSTDRLSRVTDSTGFFIDSLPPEKETAEDTTPSDSIPPPKEKTIPDTCNYFGYSLFENVPDAFKPNAFGPVDPGYLVGPGDVLRLSVWGEVEFQYELKISKEGKIFIPVAGQVYVTGIPFEQLQAKLHSILSKHYSGLASHPPKSFMDLSIAQIRPIRIFVMGEAASPGGYTVSSASTAFNALYSIGGPLVSGTLRNITVLRNGKELAVVDMYHYLVSGKCSTDVRLQNDDVIFIPRRGKTVTVRGSVFRPAIYELTEHENLLALLDYCGGVIPETNIEHALIHRVVPFQQRTPSLPKVEVVDIDLRKTIIQREDIPLFDNDTLHVIPLSYDLRNYVLLKGAVRYPGMYECNGISLHTLIFTLGKPIDEKAFTKRADLIRRNDDLITSTIIPIELERLLHDSSSYDQPLRPFDEVIVYEKEVEKPVDLLITVDGEIRKPGIYTMSTNHTVIDALIQAGGFTRGAYRKSVDIYRLRISGNHYDTITEEFKLDLPDPIDFIDSSRREFELHDRDRIVVRPNPDYILDNYVILDGFVKFKGKYAIHQRGERLSDIIARAGGLLPDAFLEGATVTRDKKRLVVNFTEALQGKSSKENILLKKGDSIFIPLRPNTVLITGNVNNPGLFSYVQKSRVRSYIDRAGGLADSSKVILLTAPGGETKKIRRVSFKNPVVQEGSAILVTKKIGRDKSAEKQGPSITEVVRDTLAILASAVTIIGLAIQFNK
ncbi:MAG: SLBB domain-containing protein [Chitinispirillaceae bacterium]|nr:SLBB domain-containing protein [Chitinispirillaceae bacterium]